MQGLKNSAMRVVGSVRETMAPVLKESQFHEKGVLTPAEFLQAGDLLVSRCPTWAWASAPPKLRVPYLPADKQYLVTRNIPCFERVSSLVGQQVEEEELEGFNDGDAGSDGYSDGDGWVATHIKGKKRGADGGLLREPSDDGGDEIVVGSDGNAQASRSIFQGVQIVENYGEGSGSGGSGGSGGSSGDPAPTSPQTVAAPATVAPTAAVAVAVAADDVDASDSDDEYADLSAFEDMSLVQEADPSALPAPATSAAGESKTSSATSGAAPGMMRVAEPSDTVVQCRRYDISITYDKYYQTPHVWLLGFDERGQPLNQEQIFEDIMQDYANKTVTIERHPLVESRSSVHASIHPCKHASVMKKIIDRLNDGAEAGGGARVDMYLIIFLKFLQGLLPTCNYDFTTEIDC